MCVFLQISPQQRDFRTPARDDASQSHSQMSEWNASGVRLIPYSLFLLPLVLERNFLSPCRKIFPRSRPFFFLCHVWGKKHVVSIVKFSRCSAAGVVSSGLWLAGDYYLKTWKSDRHKGKSALARLSTWGKSDASEVVQNEEETLKDVFFPFLLNACQASTDLPETLDVWLKRLFIRFFAPLFHSGLFSPTQGIKGWNILLPTALFEQLLSLFSADNVHNFAHKVQRETH